MISWCMFSMWWNRSQSSTSLTCRGGRNITVKTLRSWFRGLKKMWFQHLNYSDGKHETIMSAIQVFGAAASFYKQTVALKGPKSPFTPSHFRLLLISKKQRLRRTEPLMKVWDSRCWKGVNASSSQRHSCHLYSSHSGTTSVSSVEICADCLLC